MFDLILYGVGFTGRQTALYLARAAKPANFTWALSGRSLPKLEALRDELSRIRPELSTLPLVVAASDAAGAARVASSARVVISAAGPFAACGEPLVAACASRGVHYADATGETFWVSEMAEKYNATARASGAILVPLSGFDSVPSDAGLFYCIAAIRARAEKVERISAIAHVRGALSGGTVATAALMAANPAARDAASDPLLLVPGATTEAKVRLVAPLPDGEWPSRVPALGDDAWTQPHLMGAINTRVVRKSAALYAANAPALAAAAAASPSLAKAILTPSSSGSGSCSYAYTVGPFSYKERALARGYSAALTATVIAAAASAALSPLCAPLVRRLLPSPGEGPTDAAMARNSFKLFFVCETSGGGAPLVGCVSGGDPYAETGHSLAETGLLLAEAARTDTVKDLPAAAFGYGFLTPATALGLNLVDRLGATGWRFEMFKDAAAAEAAAAPRPPRERDTRA